MKIHRIAPLLICITFGQALGLESPGSGGDDERIRPREWLVIGGIGKYRRAPLHTDAIEAQLVAGTWKPPEQGDTVAAPDGQASLWQQATAEDDGWIRDETLRAGYAYTAVESDRRRKMLLEASGHSLVYVNGQPRGGDPYGTGWLRHPIELKEGVNHLLFLCRRGHVRAELVTPQRPVLFNARDTTLPDLIRRSEAHSWGAIPVVNTTDAAIDGLTLESRVAGGAATQTRLPKIPPMSTRKMGFRIAGSPPTDVDEVNIDLRLLRSHPNSTKPAEFDTTSLKLRVREPTQKHKRTFVSDIDGSVQYFAVTPMHTQGDETIQPALVLTLHGAGVEAMGQANAYDHKNWAHIVAPTNRRPYGFDWEDWGRWDALEVLAIAEQQLGTDPRRTYLTGHSMGGHGTWHLGSLFPDRFAAIAPSAGWTSFRSYVIAADSPDTSPIGRMLRRAASPSDTLSRSRNFAASGIYILHGDKDDNVPVTEARTMRSHLAEFHTDFAYYEQPNAGHWWGDQCVDWPPLFDFLRHHSIPADREVLHLQFATSSPAVSATHHWATIAAQIKPLEVSSVDLLLDPTGCRISGTTQNVSRLSIDLGQACPQPNSEPDDTVASAESDALFVQLDGCGVENVPGRLATSPLWLQKTGDSWRITPKPALSQKGPHRYGPLKEAFNRRFVLVYGTQGTPQENEWAFAKARLDAETFWYRANGSVDILADHEFDTAAETDRSVILYGHANSNSAWNTLLADSPVQVSRDLVTIGEHELTGGGLACLFVRPRPGSDIALVGVVTGTGIRSMRLTNTLPYFVSGVAYPDCIVLGEDVLTKGSSGVMVAGFFGNDWSATHGEFVWQSSPAKHE